MDGEVGQLLSQLQADNLMESTIVFYFSDHGSGMPRGKRWLYQSGLQVPLIVQVPDRFRCLVSSEYLAAGTNDRLVGFVDLAPTVLKLAGVEVPQHLQGHDFLGRQSRDKPSYLVGFRDRMDERYDTSRAIRDERFSYIRNYLPHRPQGTYLAYMFETPTTRIWNERYRTGDLNDVQSTFWRVKPPEELYDLKADPDQIHNLVEDPEYRDTVQRMRTELMDWMIQTGDLGLLPEGEMLARARGRPPAVLAGDIGEYPIRDILSVADLASRPSSGDLARLQEHRAASHSAIRYWVAQGLLLRAVMDMQSVEVVKAAKTMTDDESPYVVALAAETLGRFGTADDREQAMQLLIRLSDVRSEGVFAALTALNSLDWLEPQSLEIGRSLDGLPSSLKDTQRRYESYVGRMIHRIQTSAATREVSKNEALP